MKVGGRDFNEGKDAVERVMRGETPEEIRKYFVEIDGEAYPPKQVLAKVTGWERQTFTTMEAQRVLTKIGFVCRDVADLSHGPTGGSASSGKNLSSQHHRSVDAVRDGSVSDRIAAMEAALVTAQEAIAGLSARVRALEAQTR